MERTFDGDELEPVAHHVDVIEVPCLVERKNLSCSHWPQSGATH